MKIAFYSPYIPSSTVGGGEKHLLDMAQALSDSNDVYILVKEKSGDETLSELKTRYEKFFDLDLSKLKFKFSPLGTSAGFLNKLRFTKQFDYLFYWSDGSLFFSMAGTNNLHLQIPFAIHKNHWVERLKLKNWKVKNANSRFTKKVIEEMWQTTVPYVINPMVNLEEFHPNTKKEKIILNVGRFFRQLHSKKQDVLVEAFVRMVKAHPKEMRDWQLVLIGNIEDKEYFDEVRRLGRGYKVKMIANAEREVLVEYHNKASIYWHATGFGSSEELEPEKAEHFGITTLESMAAGTVPVVIKMGGQPEVLGKLLENNLWSTLSELESITLRLMKNKKELKRLSELAVTRAEFFSKKNFERRVKRMVRETQK